MWTKKGQIFVILGCISIFSGLVISRQFLVLTGFIFISLVMVSAMVNMAGNIFGNLGGSNESEEKVFKGVIFKRNLSSGRVVEDTDVEVTLSLKNGSRRTKRFEIMDKLPDRVSIGEERNGATLTVRPGREEEVRYRMHCPVKGFYNVGPVKVRESDTCRFFFEEGEVKLTDRLQVLPRTFGLGGLQFKSKIPRLYSGSTIINKPGQGSEFYSMRDYSPGDSFKDINWPAYARSKKLFVNEHEMEAVIDLMIIVDYRDLTKYGNVRNNVHLASARAAASLARQLIKRRDRVGLTIYSNKVVNIGREGGLKNLDRIMDRLTGEEPMGSLSLQACVNTIIQEVRKGMPVAVISSLEADINAYEGLKRLKAHGCDVWLICPFSESDEMFPGNAEERSKLKNIYDEERRLRIKEIMGLGVKVVEWNIEDPLSIHMASPNGGRW